MPARCTTAFTSRIIASSAPRSPISAATNSSLPPRSATGLMSVSRSLRQRSRRPVRNALPIAPAAPVIRTRSVSGLIMGTSGLLRLVQRLELLHRRAHGGDGRGRTGIDADVEEQLLELIAGQAVVEAHADVRHQLLHAAERGQHRDRDDAARGALEAGTGPHRG